MAEQKNNQNPKNRVTSGSLRLFFKLFSVNSEPFPLSGHTKCLFFLPRNCSDLNRHHFLQNVSRLFFFLRLSEQNFPWKSSLSSFLAQTIHWTQPRCPNNFIPQNWVFFSELSIPQKAFPPLLMTSNIFLVDVVSNKRRLSENKTLPLHKHFYSQLLFHVRYRLLRLSETWSSSRVGKWLAYCHVESMARQKRSLALQVSIWTTKHPWEEEIYL